MCKVGSCVRWSIGIMALLSVPGLCHGGTLVAWGRNDDGQCDVPPGDYIAMTGGERFTVAIRSDGSLAAWGADVGPTGSQIVTDIPSGNDFVSVDCGAEHCIALRSDGTATKWGVGIELPFLTNIVEVEAASQFSVVRSADGTVAASGLPPGSPPELPGTGYEKIDAGNNYYYAIDADGAIVPIRGAPHPCVDCCAAGGYVDTATGDNRSIALHSDGSICGLGGPQWWKDAVPSGNDFDAIACGWNHGLALRDDGSLIAWGDKGDAYGNRADVPLGDRFVAVAAGHWHSLALIETSVPTVSTWGLVTTVLLLLVTGSLIIRRMPQRIHAV